MWHHLRDNKLPPLDERRVGRFYLDPARFYGIHGWEALTDIMSTLLPIRVEHRFDAMAFEFDCVCEKFDKVEIGHRIPEYDLILDYQEAKEITKEGNVRYYNRIVDWRFRKR